MPTVDQIIRNAVHFLERGQRDRARLELNEAVAQHEGHPVAHYFLGMFLAQEGCHDGALQHLQIAALAMPKDRGLLYNLAVMKFNTGDIEGAAVALESAIRLQPDFAEAHTLMATIRVAQNRVGDAEHHFLAALRTAPGRRDAVYAYARLLAETGRADEAVAVLREALERSPTDLLLQDKVCMMLNYVAGVSLEEIYREHQRYGALAPAEYIDLGSVHADPDRRLRVAYISADLREHSVAYFIEPILEHHDREAFEVFCYHLGTPDDSATPRLSQKADHWRAMSACSDKTLRDTIAEDAIDIVVELAGHTFGNRLAALAQRTAPVQVSYIGYPNTTGVPSIDARIVDGTTDPPGSEEFATEKLIRLPGCFLCYRPPEVAPEASPPTGPSDRPVTFGSFNNLAKLSSPTVALWSRILESTPGSRLVLKGKTLGDPSVGVRLQERFAAHGIGSERLEFLEYAQSTREHLAAYAGVDVALDPFPYNGTTTTCEALWMGVPVVSLRGDRHAARVGASLLQAVRLPELIAADEREYQKIAQTLAADGSRRAHMRGSLRGRVGSSPLCNAKTFVPGLEAAYRKLWRAWCAGR